MAAIEHPAAREELDHIQRTLTVIAQETALAEAALSDDHKKLMDARRFDPDAVPLREMMYARDEFALRNLHLAADKPYFTRVDFKPRRHKYTDTYYIGKHGVTRRDSLDIEVVDWRSPVANLYYSGQLGPMHYTAPDGEVRGELLLKRQFGIEQGELRTIFDTDVVSQDAYLQSVLGSVGSDRLREIVTTIQAEQNFVIRHKPDRPLIVQGVAGSGKTTIALHRIAYLLYAYQDRLRPEQMMILAPSPLFLDYISGVLPDLGVDKVVQTTFPLLIGSLMGKRLPRVDAGDRLSDMLALEQADRDALARVLREKGSLALMRELDAYMDEYERRFASHGDIVYGPVTVMSAEAVYRFMMEDARPHPLERRLTEFGKLLRQQVKSAASEVEERITELCDRKVDRLCQTLPDGEERRAKIRRLFDQRDEQIKRAHSGVNDFVKQTLASFPRLDAVEALIDFWRARGGEAARYTLDHISPRRIESEDIAPLYLIAARMFALPRRDIRHLVIDEAQDFSPFEFMLLRRLTGNSSFTIVGDLMQGVHAYRGINDWNEVAQGVFGGDVTRHDLVTSYRNTVEIMNTATCVARAQPVPGQVEARPVLRHGAPPRFERFASAREQAEKIGALVSEYLSAGYSTIAIIGRTPRELRQLVRALPAGLNVALLDSGSDTYSGGVVAALATGVKGLEFDCVIMADAGERCFADTPLDGRLLYVCLTRPLHELAILYGGELTPLLSAALPEGEQP